MKYVVCLLTVLLCVAANISTAQEKADFLLIRNNGRMVLLHNQALKQVIVYRQPPLFLWEGNQSRATFRSTLEGVEIEFMLDIIGPDWLYITMKDMHDGIHVEVSRTISPFARFKELMPETVYPSYEAFLNDAHISELGLDKAIVRLMQRYGQNPQLPEVRSLRYSYFGIEPARNSVEETVCRYLIRLMDSDSWQVRQGATMLVSRLHLVERVMDVSKVMTLSPEQKERVNSLATQLTIYVAPELKFQFEHLALSDDEIANLSD